jgi:hypothetical protein
MEIIFLNKLSAGSQAVILHPEDGGKRFLRSVVHIHPPVVQLTA